MSAELLLFWPGWAGLVAVAAADAVVGWGASAAAVGLLGTAVRVPLHVWGLGLALAAIAVVVWRLGRRRTIAVGWLWRVLALALPLLLLVAGSDFTNWDDFTHWLPNAGYLYRYDAFPSADLPPSPSVWPAYPYGLTLWSYFISLVSGRFVERGGALANVLLLAVFGGTLAQLVAERVGMPMGRSRQWGIAAIGLLAATALNPGFAPSFAITAWSDSATSVALGTSGVLGWRLLERLREEDVAEARALAWQFGLSAMALVNLRQANPVLLALLLAGMGLVVLRDPALRIGSILRLAAPMLIPPILLTLAWRHYVGANLPAGEFHILPLAEWRLAELPRILAGAFRQSYPKAFYYEMLLITGLGIVGLWRPSTPLRRLSSIVAVIFVGYTGFLIFAYVAAAFPLDEAFRAASFWRYSTHAALLAMAACVYGLTQLWMEWRSPLRQRIAAGGAALAVLVPALVLLFPGALVRPVRPEEAFIRGIGRELAETLPAGTKLTVVLPDALVFYMLNYELMRLGRDDRRLGASIYVVESMGAEERKQRLSQLAEDPSLHYAFTIGRYVEGAAALPGALAPNEAALYVRGEGEVTSACSGLRVVNSGAGRLRMAR